MGGMNKAIKAAVDYLTGVDEARKIVVLAEVEAHIRCSLAKANPGASPEEVEVRVAHMLGKIRHGIVVVEENHTVH